MSENEMSQSDTQFIVECLRNLDTDRQVNIPRVANNLGYGNVMSAANRLRSLRKRHGFVNLEGKTTGFSASAAPPATKEKKSGDCATRSTKRGRPARVKTTTSTSEHTGDFSVEIKNNSKRKHPGEDDDDVKFIEPKPQQLFKKPGRRPRNKHDIIVESSVDDAAPAPASAAAGSNTTSAATTGLGKANSRALHFVPFTAPSKRRKMQEDADERTQAAKAKASKLKQLNTPSKRIFHFAAETIREARWERRKPEATRSGLKLVFKVKGKK